MLTLTNIIKYTVETLPEQQSKKKKTKEHKNKMEK